MSKPFEAIAAPGVVPVIAIEEARDAVGDIAKNAKAAVARAAEIRGRAS